ncbi:uncharacterized protein PHALS_15187 [Plasmopara halstedii]|uniref:Uncharacterized protein n=1 Tax=Plasmopara halstedii TaxID=4781 RepID=A0A0P1B682_PLAHL|nr:uncharacterized protein PHALS_15187 [Plasmopara halstedii]CEG49048.1 hypothetical protein PHALS_15187 [Plasmopara halstedii]|eukprot:XP_024585417.1 hypothetical protein PHALS_15187 [Plasmopara halstedii]
MRVSTISTPCINYSLINTLRQTYSHFIWHQRNKAHASAEFLMEISRLFSKRKDSLRCRTIKTEVCSE